MVRIVWFVGLVGLLTCPRAWATNRVLVFESIETPEKLRDEVGEAIQAALREHSFTDVLFAKQADQACETLSCQVELARQKNVDCLLLAKGMASGTGYQLSIEIRDVPSGRILGSDSKECELCDPRDFPNVARERTRLVLNRVQQEILEQKALKPPKPGPPPGPPSSVPAIHPTTLPPWVERGFWEQPTPVVGLGLALAGAGTLSMGIYLMAVDGNDVCAAGERPPCPQKRDTKTGGFIATGVGVAALVVGSTLAIWGQDSTRDLHVAIRPNSIGLWGRF